MRSTTAFRSLLQADPETVKSEKYQDFSLIATSNFGDHETDTPIHYEIFTQSRQARKVESW